MLIGNRQEIDISLFNYLIFYYLIYDHSIIRTIYLLVFIIFLPKIFVFFV